MIAGNRFRAAAGPFHGPAGPLGGEHHRQKLRIDFVSHAEGAADIGRADQKLLVAETRDLRQRRLQIAGALAWRPELELLLGGVVLREAGLRLHRVAGNSLGAELDADDMRGAGKSLLGALPVAVFVIQRQVVGQFVVDAGGARSDALRRLDDDRQILVFDLDEFGGILGEMLGLRDDQRHRLTHETNAVVREASPERHAKRAAADAFEERQHRRRLPPGRDHVGAGHDVQDTRLLSRRRDIDLHDPGVRPVGAQEVRRGLTVDVVVGRVPPAAGHQPEVFTTPFELMFGQSRILSAKAFGLRWQASKYARACVNRSKGRACPR